MGIGFDGILVLDKPGGITSRAAVNRAQTWFPRGTRIGHAGTLDPLATGVLVLGIGQGTRLTEYVQRMPKVYRAVIVLGATSDTDDADGVVVPYPNASQPDRAAIEHALARFVGAIEQVPPAYSAAKVAGRRAHELARKGKDVALAPRTVTVHGIDIGSFHHPRLELTVRCGKGTYIRSLARDLGTHLGCGGYITALRRLAIGPFTVEDALSLDLAPQEARIRPRPIVEAVADLPGVIVAPEEMQRMRQGQRIPKPGMEPTVAEEVVVFDEQGEFCAIARLIDGLLCPVKVLA